MATRKNQIGQSGVGRQVSRHRGDRPGRQSAALGATDISTGSNLRVNSQGQLVVKKARSIARLVVDPEEDNSVRIDQLVASLNELVNALQAAKLMER